MWTSWEPESSGHWDLQVPVNEGEEWSRFGSISASKSQIRSRCRRRNEKNTFWEITGIFGDEKKPGVGNSSKAD